jgi:hypothetical protein
MASKEKIILWLPRLLCIGAILFVSVFALDAFEPGTPFAQQLLNFLIHLIPTYILLLFLWIAWEKPFAGGILFVIIGIITSPLVYNLNYNRTHSVMTSLSIILMITIPFIVVGILFLISHKQGIRK